MKKTLTVFFLLINASYATVIDFHNVTADDWRIKKVTEYYQGGSIYEVDFHYGVAYNDLPAGVIHDGLQALDGMENAVLNVDDKYYTRQLYVAGTLEETPTGFNVSVFRQRMVTNPYSLDTNPLGGSSYSYRNVNEPIPNDYAWVTMTPTFTAMAGDANYDGLFNSDDLVQVSSANTYDQPKRAVWASGDFSGDFKFTSEDLILASSTGMYGAQMGLLVPEPHALFLLILGMLLCKVREE